MGQTVSSYLENYPSKMAKALVTGMALPRMPSFGQAVRSEAFYESEKPHFDGQFGHLRVARCGLFAGEIRRAASHFIRRSNSV